MEGMGRVSGRGRAEQGRVGTAHLGLEMVCLSLLWVHGVCPTPGHLTLMLKVTESVNP